MQGWSSVTKLPNYLMEQPSVGNCFEIDGLVTAALCRSKMANSRRFFFRQESADLWNNLSECETGMVIQGPPGVGKSSLVWAWLCHKSQRQGKKVLWIHLSPSSLPKCVEMGPTSLSYVSAEISDALQLLKSTDADIVVDNGFARKCDSTLQLK